MQQSSPNSIQPSLSIVSTWRTLCSRGFSSYLTISQTATVRTPHILSLLHFSITPETPFPARFSLSFSFCRFRYFHTFQPIPKSIVITLQPIETERPIIPPGLRADCLLPPAEVTDCDVE